MTSPDDRHISKLVPRSSVLLVSLLIAASMIQSTTFGYDASMITPGCRTVGLIALRRNGLNILPSYADYFHLNVVTTALNTSIVHVGNALAGLANGLISDHFGRRPAMLWAAIITIIGVILQAAAQNIAMFIATPFAIGFGVGVSSAAAPPYLAETVPCRWRAFALGLSFDCWRTAAGITYGTAKIESTWAWRIPSLLQGVFSVLCIAILPFIPESPRWLAYQGRHQEAQEALAAALANGDTSDPAVIVEMREMIDTLEHEKRSGQRLTLLETVRSPHSRKRLLLSTSVAVFAMLSDMLDDAGITDSTTQLEINIILNAFCLVVSVVGSAFAERLGRRVLAISSTGLLTIFIFIIGGLTKLYGTSTNASGELQLRLELLFVIFCWVETKGKTLEEIDAAIEGVKRGAVPDLDAVIVMMKLEGSTDIVCT
ncbi:putative sugar transporter [Thermoascus aurantiacus ATCC 26904]